MAYRKINIDFSTLPSYPNNRIKWDECVNKIVNYSIDGTNYSGVIKIEDVFDKKLKIKIDNDKSLILYKSIFKDGKIAKEFGVKSKYFKYEIGQEVNGLLILEKILITRTVNSNGNRVPSTENGYLVRCLSDGYEFEVLEKILTRRKNCPICGYNAVVPGINDIATTDPEFAKWIVNPLDAISYTRNTNKSLLLKCPICGREFIGIPNRYKNLPSCVCNDHVSYPEKIMSSILDQLQIQYIHQLNSKHFNWCQTYRYDFYFEYNTKKYIVEMDGIFHYKQVYKNGVSINDIRNKDIQKDKIAHENGCTMIRIDSSYQNLKKRRELVRANILSSELSKIFNLSEINWDECERFASTSLVVSVNNLWNEGLTKVEIQRKTGLGDTTVSEYLKKGSELGLSDYAPGERHYFSKVNNKYLKVENSNNEILCIHNGINDFMRNSEKILGYKINNRLIYNSLKNKASNKKGLKFSYATEDEYYSYLNAS